MEVAVSGRTAEQVEAAAAEVGGRALVGDVTNREDVERWFSESGPLDLLVANAGTAQGEGSPWERDPEVWWRTFEVNALGDRIPVFVISPGMVRTEMTSSFPEDMPWTPPECAPRLVRALASGEFDALSGRYLHAEHDPPEELEARIEEILRDDLNAI